MAGLGPNRADYHTVGKIGGAENVTLTVAEMPSNAHGSDALKNNGNVSRDTSGQNNTAS